jgi:beta-lactamase regulating signal transducer with metallopeptidase domain
MTLFVLKLTLLLTLGTALAALLRGRSAATRHFVWTLTLFSALLLAAATWVAPALTVEIPDWRPRTTFVDTAPKAAVNVPTTTRATAQRTDADVAAPAIRNAPIATWWSTAPLATLWMLGVAAMLLWSLAGHLGLARIARRARPVEDDGLIAETLRQSGVTRPVRFGTSTSVSAPVTWGSSHPIVLLPGDAMSWPTERRRAALLHELAHVARNDYLIQLLAGFACALYWFHPVAWFALRRLRRESEQASDDRVLARGMIAPDYATHLVDVAVTARARRFGGLLVLGMACPSHLETRLRALLDETRARNVVSRRAIAVAAVVSLLVLLPLAAARPAIRAAKRVDRTMHGNPIDFGRSFDRMSRAVTRPIGRAFRTIHRSGSTIEVSDVDGPTLSVPQKTISASPGETLLLDLETGGSVEVSGWDEPRVTVDARLGGRDANETRVDVERDSEGVRVRSQFVGSSDSHSTSHQFVIRVPRRFNVRIDSAGGGMSVENVEGLFKGTTGGGGLTLTHVKGTAELSTGGGEIDVDDVDLDGHVSTGGGKVTLTNVRGGLRGSSGSEPVVHVNGSEVRSKDSVWSNSTGSSDSDSVTTYMNDEPNDHPRLPRGAVDISKAGGSVDLDDAPNGARINTGGGDITVGSSSGLVDATTGGGDVRIGPVAGSVRASTGAGDVEITVTDPAGREQSVQVFTGSGNVVVILPATLDAKFDIETAYTRKASPTHIDSVWELDHKPPTDWDSSAGTPRRFVRATGIAGKGRGLVKIKAVNGDITLRRGR